MIEIIILYFLVRNLGKIAQQKGESTVRWKILGVLAWLAGEITGIMIILALLGKDNLIVSLLFGLGMAYLFFLLLKSSLDSKPDIEEPNV